MRTPDTGMARAKPVTIRLDPAEVELLDAKRGSLSVSAWLRAAIRDWDGPGSTPHRPIEELHPRDRDRPSLKAASEPGPRVADESGHVHDPKLVRTWVHQGVLTHRWRCDCGKTKDVPA